GIFRVIIAPSSAKESAGSRLAVDSSLTTSRLVQVSSLLMHRLRKLHIPPAVFPPDPQNQQAPDYRDGYAHQRDARQAYPRQGADGPGGKHITAAPDGGLYEVLGLVLGFPRNHGVEHVARGFRQAICQAAAKHLEDRYHNKDRIRRKKCESDDRDPRQYGKRHADPAPWHREFYDHELADERKGVRRGIRRCEDPCLLIGIRESNADQFGHVH